MNLLNLFKKPSGKEDTTLKEVKIGNQVWMTENFRGGENSTPSNGSWNSSKYGDIYAFSQAISNAPKGWHLPDVKEFNELSEFIGNSDNPKKLWGQFNIDFFNGRAMFWTILRQVGGSGVRHLMAEMGKNNFDNGIYRFETYDKGEMYSYPVRYVKDQESEK